MDCPHVKRTLIKESGFLLCVAPSDCDPGAHGCITCISLGKTYGATRMVNENSNFIEFGQWEKPESTNSLDSKGLQT